MAFAENGINAIYRLGVLVYVVIAMMTLFVIIRGIRYHYKRKQQPLVRLVTDLDKLSRELRQANFQLQEQMQARLMTEREATLLRRLKASQNFINLEVTLAELDKVVQDVTALIPEETQKQQQQQQPKICEA